MGCQFLLQRIFPTQGSNPGLPHCRKILYHLSHQGSHLKTMTAYKYVKCFCFIFVELKEDTNICCLSAWGLPGLPSFHFRSESFHGLVRSQSLAAVLQLIGSGGAARSTELEPGSLSPTLALLVTNRVAPWVVLHPFEPRFLSV